MILPSCWLVLQIDTNLVINLQHIVQQIVCFRCSMISPFQLVIIVLVTTSIGYISRNYVRIDIDIDIDIDIYIYLLVGSGTTIYPINGC